MQEVNAFIRESGNGICDFDILEWPVIPTLDERLAETATQQTTTMTSLDLNSEEIIAKFTSLEVDRNDISVNELLGQGAFGTVNLATFHQKSNNNNQSVSVAVKMLKPHSPEPEKKQFEYEAKLLSALHHRSIVHVVAVCFHSEPFMLVLELMSNGDLRSYLKKHAPSLRDASSQLASVCLQVVDAMAYLEQRKIIHRDLAARSANSID